MAISVHCSATHIHIVEGSVSGKKLTINSYVSAPVPEGAIINGMIIDEENFLQALKHMVANKVLPAKKTVSLVVDSSNIMMRTLAVPLLSNKEVLKHVQRELSIYLDDAVEHVYDFAVLQPKLNDGGGSILAVAAGKPLLESYVRVFKAAGLNVSNIRLGASCQIKLAQFLPAFKDQTFILTQVDGNSLVLTLYDKGNYMLANRYRLLNTFGSIGWYDEFDDHISSMIQFNKGQKSNNDVSVVYADGLTNAGVARIRDTLAGFKIAVAPFPFDKAIALPSDAANEFQLGKYQYCVGNLLMKK
ncbi:pilus assembly protein PilM [Eubacteriales bacterium OttesenSCG-928-K08]|nr:pilus assembly protein PilM [Eubacteriales bacterium OttesenSCG-928-K08]